VDSYNFSSFNDDALRRSLAADVMIPLCLGGPLLLLLLRKVQQLAIAHREASIIASTDSLTAVLNRGAFTMFVESYLAKAEEQAALRSGSFLVIDADHFKGINDTLGHQQGDLALRIIAGSIKANLRDADIVGRIGGEEFGVFLPGAKEVEANEIAERIRGVISGTIFPLGSEFRRLSVSIGGLVYSRLAS
jgi:diguanylate cyclase (GGDEF)-like protein